MKSRHPAAVKSRKRRRAYRRRLLKMLGEKCNECGTDKHLEPHHKKPRTWRSREKWALTRLAIYLKEAAAGELELLCRACNLRAGQPVAADDNDF